MRSVSEKIDWICSSVLATPRRHTQNKQISRLNPSEYLIDAAHGDNTFSPRHIYSLYKMKLVEILSCHLYQIDSIDLFLSLMRRRKSSSIVERSEINAFPLISFISIFSFVKDLSPDKINVSAFRGEGDLSNLQLNEDVLTDLLELPSWIRLTSAWCNHVSFRISWTKLKSVPITLVSFTVILFSFIAFSENVFVWIHLTELGWSKYNDWNMWIRSKRN